MKYPPYGGIEIEYIPPDDFIITIKRIDGISLSISASMELLEKLKTQLEFVLAQAKLEKLEEKEMKERGD